MSRILIVDDEKSIRVTLKEFLINEGYYADTAQDGSTALQMIEQTSYDIIVSDIIMPKISGVELLEKVREITDSVQFIIMTGEPTVETAIKAVQSGANDYLSKPIKKDLFLASVRSAVKVKKLESEKKNLEEEREKYRKNLENIVRSRTIKLQNAMQSIITLLANVIEVRDPYTAGHQRHVGNLSAMIAQKAGYSSELVDFMRIIGYVHDIGKIVIPTEILSKPGNLSPLELEMIKLHPLSGYDMLCTVDLPENLCKAILQHHERCDGSGYPNGTKEDKLTIEAKILIVADVVEAMISHRPYRPALGIEAALNEINKNAGTLYSKEIVDVCTGLFLEDGYEIDDNAYNINFPV